MYRPSYYWSLSRYLFDILPYQRVAQDLFNVRAALAALKMLWAPSTFLLAWSRWEPGETAPRSLRNVGLSHVKRLLGFPGIHVTQKPKHTFNLIRVPRNTIGWSVSRPNGLSLYLSYVPSTGRVWNNNNTSLSLL